MSPFARVLVGLSVGFGVGLILFRPSARYTDEDAVKMAAAPLVQSIQSSRALVPMTSQKQFLQPMQRLPTIREVFNGKFAHSRGIPMKAMPIGEIAEAGKLFDFDATLPIVVAEFLTMMVILDKTMFSPLGKVMAERDEYIRSRTADLKGNSDEIKALEDKAAKLIADAKAEQRKMLEENKEKNDKEYAERIAAEKATLEAKFKATIAALDKEMNFTPEQEEKEAEELSKMFLKKLLPEGFEPAKV